MRVCLQITYKWGRAQRVLLGENKLITLKGTDVLALVKSTGNYVLLSVCYAALCPARLSNLYIYKVLRHDSILH